MKKLTLVVLLTLSGSVLFAQVSSLNKAMPPTSQPRGIINSEINNNQDRFKGGGDIFWHEEFDWADSTSGIGWYLPDDWALEDPTDVGYNWHWANDTLRGAYVTEAPIQSTTQHNGFLALNLGGYNQDYSHYDEFLSVDNTIISPVIDCSEHSSVLIRLEQNFRFWPGTEQIFSMTNDGGVHWAEFDMSMGTLINERVGGIGSGEKVDLFMNFSDVAAGMPEVQFKISWRNAALYYWMIDDIVFMEGWDYDLQMVYIEADYDNGIDDPEGFFYAVPYTQISPYTLHGLVNNFGNLEQWGTHINATVTKNNEIIWNENSNTVVSYPDADPNVVDTLRWESQFTPDEFGHYQFDFTLLSENEDERPYDNTASMPFMVTDSLFSRCDENAELSFSTWQWYTFQHEGDMMGTHYTIKEDIEINSIAAYIWSADILSSFRMVLLGIDEETNDYFELLGSEYVDMDSTILREHWVTVPLEKDGEGEFLEAGKTYMAAIEFWNNMDYEEAYDSRRYYVGSDRSNFFPGGTSVQYWSEDDSWGGLSNDLVMIRMHFNDDSNIIDKVDVTRNESSWVAQNFPNPFRDISLIRYSISDPGPVEFVIMDQLGKKVFEEKLGNQTAGEHEYQVNSENLESGIYFYTISAGSFSETRRMVVK